MIRLDPILLNILFYVLGLIIIVPLLTGILVELKYKMNKALLSYGFAILNICLFLLAYKFANYSVIQNIFIFNIYSAIALFIARDRKKAPLCKFEEGYIPPSSNSSAADNSNIDYSEARHAADRSSSFWSGMMFGALFSTLFHNHNDNYDGHYDDYHEDYHDCDRD